jgi:hypothetical protein
LSPGFEQVVKPAPLNEAVYRFDELAVVAKEFVEVELPKTARPRFAFVPKRFVELAVVAKLLVEVELVVVLF